MKRSKYAVTDYAKLDQPSSVAHVVVSKHREQKALL